LRDPNYPIFGFGGCGVPARNYSNNIVKPWERLKDDYFNGHSAPLHAADVRKSACKRNEALGTFFRQGSFFRIATVLTNATDFNNNQIDHYNMVVRSFYSRMDDILKWNVFDEIMMILEDSRRTNEPNTDYFARYKYTRKDENGVPRDIPCHRYIMSKREQEPGLEVADFIAHTAGTCVNARLNSPYDGEYKRENFKSVFMPANERWASFMELLKAA